MHWKENMFSESNVNICILKGTGVFRMKKNDYFMHSKSNQNKNSMYSLCLVNNYLAGPGPRGHEYNLPPRGYRLRKQQESRFCINSPRAWGMHDWEYTRECLEGSINSSAIESILLLLAQFPSPISSSPCPVLRRHLITMYLWLNKGWHPQLGSCSESITLQATSKPLGVHASGETVDRLKFELCQKALKRKLLSSDLRCRVMDSGTTARPRTLNGWTDVSRSEI